MKQSAPLYILSVKNKKDMHLSIGKEPETLCGLDKIESAYQVENLSNPNKDVFKKSDEFCSICKEKWEIAEGYVRVEPTIKCHRCGYPYSSYMSKVVEHEKHGEVPVCKSCHYDLKKSNNSGVNEDYNNSEDYIENEVSRKFEVPSELKKKWKQKIHSDNS